MQITLVGFDRPVRAEADETILTSLLRAGAPFPFSCQAGNCGTCRCELVSGDIVELQHSELALDAQARARGVILACRTLPRGDAVIRRLDLPSRVPDAA